MNVRLRLRPVAVAALLLLVTGAGAAEAKAAPVDADASDLPAITADEAPPAPASTERAWYGWQIMLSDLASVGAFTVGAVSWKSPAASEAMLAASGLGYQFGGPAVHLAHGRWGAAGWSLLRRFVLPAGGGLAGALLAGKDRGSDEEIPASAAGAALGIASGFVVAMAYDWVTAREDAARPPPAALEDASDAAASRWAPVVAFGRDRATFGVALNF